MTSTLLSSSTSPFASDEIFSTSILRAASAPAKCTGESSRGGRDDVIDGRRVRLKSIGRNAVMLRDRSVDAERHRFLLPRQPGEPDRSPLLSIRTTDV